MKQIKIFFFLFLLLCFVLHSAVFARETLEIDSIYATSSQNPDEVENILAGGGRWMPQEGLSSREGVMIYFSKKVNIEKIKIEGFSFKNGGSIYGYINGSETISSDFISRDHNNFNEQWLYGLEGKEVISIFLGLSYVDKNPGIKKITFYGKGDQILTPIFPRKVKGRIEASSILSPYPAYKPNNLFDSKFETAWVEGVDGSGNGQTLKFNFNNEVKITKIKIWNGYQRSLKHFNANEKVSEFSFGKTDDANLPSYTLKNSMTAQEVVLKTPLTGNQFVLNISKVFSGASYKDLAISEVSFFDGERWFKLQPTDMSTDIEKIMEKTRGSFLEKMINKNIQLNKKGQSIDFALRSDGTFAYWLSRSDGTVATTHVADGNWESLDGSGKIRVFGRYKQIENIYIPYSPSVQNTKEEIFQDTLVITEKEISSSRLFKGGMGYIFY